MKYILGGTVAIGAVILDPLPVPDSPNSVIAALMLLGTVIILGMSAGMIKLWNALQTCQSERLTDMREMMPLLRIVATGQDKIVTALEATVTRQAQIPEDRSLDRIGIAGAIEALNRKVDALSEHRGP